METDSKQTGIEVKLVGHDGNVFNLLARCAEALRRCDLPADEVDRVRQEFMDEATSGDYEHLLMTCVAYFVVA